MVTTRLCIVFCEKKIDYGFNSVGIDYGFNSVGLDFLFLGFIYCPFKNEIWVSTLLEKKCKT